MVKRNLHGFTLIEILVVLAIISVLTALIFAAFAPARAKAREANCTSNLHQWGKALAMYIADHDGMEAVTGTKMSYADLGLPPAGYGLESFCKTYKIWESPLAHCPAEHRRRPPLIGYHYEAPPPGNEEFFSDGIQMRGSKYPIVICSQHDFAVDSEEKAMLPSWSPTQRVFLRLNQQVSWYRTTIAGRKSSNSW